MTKPRVYCFGEALIDRFPDRREVAGAPLHVAVHLAHLGWDAALISRVGEDEDGNRVVAALAEHGVDTSLVERDPQLPTGTVDVALGGGGHTFAISKRAAWDAIAGPDRLPNHDAVVYGTLAARSTISRETLQRLLKLSNSLRVWDANLRPPDVSRSVVRETLHAAHLAKLSAEELAEVGDLLGLGGEPAPWFGGLPALRWICVTRGEDGAEMWDWRGRVWHAEAEPVDAEDTVGAGDAFLAALVDGMVRGWEEGRVLRHAGAHAAAVLRHQGGLPA